MATGAFDAGAADFGAAETGALAAATFWAMAGVFTAFAGALATAFDFSATPPRAELALAGGVTVVFAAALFAEALFAEALLADADLSATDFADAALADTDLADEVFADAALADVAFSAVFFAAVLAVLAADFRDVLAAGAGFAVVLPAAFGADALFDEADFEEAVLAALADVLVAAALLIVALAGVRAEEAAGFAAPRERWGAAVTLVPFFFSFFLADGIRGALLLASRCGDGT